MAIELPIVDWPRVEAAAPSDRQGLLVDAAFGEAYSDDLFEHGWSCSTPPGENCDTPTPAVCTRGAPTSTKRAA